MLIDSSGFKAVLRTKPPGALLSSKAHAIDREYRILKTLKSKSKIPVPLVYHYSQDTELIGSPFYVMEFLEGRIISDPSLPTVNEADTANYYKEIIDVLGALHSVDYKSIGLADYGPSCDYYPRQLKTLLRISKIQGSVKDDNGVEVGDLPYLNENMKWLFANLPQDEIAIVHGDYKNDNIVFHSRGSKILGLLDWELSTIGHPLSDLANLLLPFYVPQDGAMTIMASMSVKRPLRVPNANVLMKWYCQINNRPYPIKNWNFCIAFAFFRVEYTNIACCYYSRYCGPCKT